MFALKLGKRASLATLTIQGKINAAARCAGHRPAQLETEYAQVVIRVVAATHQIDLAIPSAFPRGQTSMTMGHELTSDDPAESDNGSASALSPFLT